MSISDMNNKILPSLIFSASLSLLAACNDSDNETKTASFATSPSPSTSSNGLASQDQVDAERNALDFISRTEAKTALQNKAQDLLAIAKKYNTPIDDYNLKLLESSVQESAFASLLTIFNIDVNNEKIVSTLAAPHSWFGLNVLGSRTVFDNPDTTYRTIPIDPNISYIIKGEATTHIPLDVNFSQWDSNNQTLANLATKDLVRNADGSFEIYVSKSTAPSTYKNSIVLQDKVVKLFIRNTINDWKNQYFDKLSIERTDGSKRVASISTDQQYQYFLSTATTAGSAYNYYYQLANAPLVNTLPEISLGGSAGRLSTQAATYSSFDIADDEALVYTTTLGGANYFILPVYNQWFITTDYINTTQTLNNAQSIANADGSYTYVIAKQDPGVYNWINTDGLNRGYLNPRWQGLSGNAIQVPTASIQKVKIAALKSVLPSGTKYVTTTERKQQLTERKASYQTRYTP